MGILLFIQFVLTGAIRSGTSVLYATLGETVTERAGVTNLGTEGCMIMGACFGFKIAADTGNLFLAVLAAALAGGALSLIHAYLVINRGANQLASGLALGFFGLGLTALIGRPYVSQNIVGLGAVPIPLLADIPFVGPILFNHDILTYLSYLCGPLIWLFLYRTRFGLSLRAVGESTAVAFSTGRDPLRIQYAAICCGGMMSGLGAHAGDPAGRGPEESLRRAGRPGGGVPAHELSAGYRTSESKTWCAMALASFTVESSVISRQCRH